MSQESSNPHSAPIRPANGSGVMSRLAWFFNAGWIDRALAQRRFEHQFRKDSLGHSIHLALSCFMIAVACMPSGIIDVGVIILLAYAFLRLTNTYSTFWRPILMPLSFCLMAFAAWHALSVSWSIDRAHGWNEFYKLRWLAFISVLWPVLDRRSALIAALCVGLFLGNISQVVQAIGRHYNVYNALEFFTGSNIDWMEDHARIGGWWHPLAAGTMLIAALGLHLPAAIMGSGRARLIGLAGSAVSLIGIVATGTRGAMLAAVPLIIIAFLIAFFRIRPSRKSLGFAALALFIAACIAMMTVGPGVIRRIDMATREVQLALSGKDLRSDNGARIQMALWAIEAVKARPLTGMGAGSFETWSTQRVLAMGKLPAGPRTDDPTKIRVFEHAHNSILHIAATTGLIGAALALLVVVASLWAAFVPLTRQQWGTYAAGPGFALIGMYLVSMTDPVHFNTQTSILLGILLALCPVWTPSRPVLSGVAA